MFIVAFSLFLELAANIQFTVLKYSDDPKGVHVDMNRKYILLFVVIFGLWYK
jgi:hypothetical protein